MKKKVIVMGVGAQGSTIADRLNNMPEVDEIVCADCDSKEIERLKKNLRKQEE